MPKSINYTDETLEKLIANIESVGNSIKIFSQDLRENVEGSLFDQNPLPENVPSRASLAEFSMRRFKKYVFEITELTDDLEKHIFQNYSDKT